MLSIGIVGLPNVGKSTLFNAITHNNILAANYPFATIEPNTGIVPVPDSRLNKLAEIYHSEKVIPATVTIVDIAGLVAGASQGEGLGNKFLSNIRECDAIIHVIRAFRDKDVVRISGPSDPKSDMEVVNTELILADIQTIQSRLQRLVREAKASNEAAEHKSYLENLMIKLQTGKPLSQITDLDADAISDLHLLTAKPVIYVFNVDESTLGNEDEKQRLKSIVGDAQALFICVKLEAEMNELPPDEAEEMLASYGIKETGLMQLAQAAYDTLGLQSFLTAGPKEVRAWTIKKGALAPQAAGVIHSDFEKGFIAANVVDYNDLIRYGSELGAKTAGKVRTEGKDYIMQPDDVVEFKFNVSKH